jgi:dienelactone hydrolase
MLMQTADYTHCQADGTQAAADDNFTSSLWPPLRGVQTAANPEAGAVIQRLWQEELAASSQLLQREMVLYYDGDCELQGYIVRPSSQQTTQLLPCVLVAHTAVGVQEDLMLYTLDRIAALGYIAFGLDMFGTRQALWNRAESLAARAPLTADRSLMRQRATAALDAALALSDIDPSKVAIVGYCFGGLVALDLARSGAAVKAAITFHGILTPPSPPFTTAPVADCKVLVLHGEQDPFVPPAQVHALLAEMQRSGTQCSVQRYSSAGHAFTRPEKVMPTDKQSCLWYDDLAAASSWTAMQECLREVFS